jgi:hypothetical protein
MSWRDVQQQLAVGITWLRSREIAIGGGAITLDQALLEELVAIDSEQVDALATLGEGGKIDYADDGSVRLGQLQRIRRMRTTFFGDSETGATGLLDNIKDQGPSLIDALQDLPDKIEGI